MTWHWIVRSLYVCPWILERTLAHVAIALFLSALPGILIFLSLRRKKGLIKHATHVVGRKALKHTHPKQHLTPLQKKLAMLQKEVSEEEKERHELMEEMKEDMGEVNKDRAHDRKDHHNEKEDKELMEELRKVTFFLCCWISRKSSGELFSHFILFF